MRDIAKHIMIEFLMRKYVSLMLNVAKQSQTYETNLKRRGGSDLRLEGKV